MAAKDIKHLKEHFLTCDICVEIYEDPITLACGHTFCRKCYIRYCQENRQATSKKALQCPTCKQCSNVQNPGEKVDGSWNVADWVKPLKPSFVMRKLLDDFVTKERGSCITNQSPDSERSSKKKNMVLCPIHKSDIAYLCKICKIPVCSDCGLQNHMKCGDVVKIESMESEIRSNLETTLETITRKLQQTEEWMKDVKHQMGNFSRMELNVREKVKITKESAFKMIRDWEREILEELNSATEHSMFEMSEQLKVLEADLKIFQRNSEFIKHSLEKENGIDMIYMFKALQSEASLIEADRNTFSDLPQDVADILFEVAFEQNEMKKTCHLGNLRVKKIRNNRTLTAIPLQTIYTRIPRSSLTNVLVMEVDGMDVLIATDSHHSRLNSFYVSKNVKQQSIFSFLGMKNVAHCVSFLEFLHQPWCVTRLSSNQVAVSLCGVSEIVLVKVTPDLTIQSTITTQREYSGLTSLGETTLAAGCHTPPCVDILDLRGRVKKTITPDGSLIRCPIYLSTTQEGNILVSDYVSKSVVCLTPGGDVVFTYPPTGDRALGKLAGITTTTTGDILVVDYSNNRVIQLTGAGEYVRDLLTALRGIYFIDRPFGICVHKDLMYIVGGPYSGRGEITVFRLSDRKLRAFNIKLVMCFMVVALLIYMNIDFIIDTLLSIR